MSTRTIRGPEKAIVFLLSLDESTAARILAQFDESEVRKAKEALEKIGHISSESLQSVHEEFLTALDKQSVVVRSGGDQFRRLTARAFGPERATKLLQEPRSEALTTLGRVDTTTLAGFLGEEHPQAIAAILAHLEPERGAEVLSKLDKHLQCDVVGRMSALDSIPRSVLEDAERVLAAGLTADREISFARVDGVSRAAAILNRMIPETSQDLLDRLGEMDSEQAMAIKRALFTFEDLTALDRRGMQVLLKELATEHLVLSLKMASDELKDKIFAAMSKRAGETLRDDLETLGPVKLSDVERARQEIAEVALRLQSDGKLSITAAGGDECV